MISCRKLAGIAGATALAVTAIGYSVTANTQETTKLVYATYLPDTYAMVKLDNWFMEEVTERTDGRITFEPYYAGTLLKASDVLPGVAAGAADIGNSVPSAYNRKDYPLSNVTLPFITSHVDSVAKAYRALYDQNEQFRDEYESKGLKLLYAPAYAENTIWSTKPIEKPSDVEGLKVRAVLAIGDALAKMGASVVSIPWPDAVEGMERGVVDAMSAAPFDTAVSAGLPDVGEYGSDVGRMGVYAVSATVISMDTWNSLDAETQKIVEEVAAEAPDHYLGIVNDTVDELAQQVAEKVKAGDVKISHFSDEDAQQMRETIGQEIWQEWIETANAAGVDGEAILEEYRALAAQYDKESDYTPGMQRVQNLLNK